MKNDKVKSEESILGLPPEDHRMVGVGGAGMRVSALRGLRT